MYGLVNRAVQDLITEQHGAETWQRIASAAGCSDVAFVGMQVYDDALTYQLVGAAANELGTDPGTLLEAFGEYWIRFTAAEGYGDLMSLFGNTFEEFLSNLDAMHARIGLTMEDLVPPSFRFERGLGKEHRLVYRSFREGLAPMVKGLLRGLAGRFGVEVEIDLQPREQSNEPDMFTIRVGVQAESKATR